LSSPRGQGPEPALELVDVKTLLVFDPTTAMAATQTTMIKPAMTAYSTAVGPSSRLQNLATEFFMKVNISSRSLKNGQAISHPE
jgi:hypothetical protein